MSTMGRGLSRRSGSWLRWMVWNLIAACGVGILALWGIERIWPLPPLPTPLPTATPIPTATPRPPLMYTVQPGDTLIGIAARYGVSLESLLRANGLSPEAVIYPGQVLRIPGELPAVPPPIPSPSPLPSPAPAADGIRLRVLEIRGVGDVEQETLVLVNEGATLSLAGWRLRDADGNLFVFPALTLWAGSRVAVHTRAGENTATDLYWGRDEAVWQPGERGVLEDPEGTVVLEFRIPSPRP
jgi:LysM repeat protein